LELVHENLVTRLRVAHARLQAELAKILHAIGSGFLHVPGRRLVQFLGKLDQSQLHGVVSVRGWGLPLHDHAWASLQHRNRNNLPVGRNTCVMPIFLPMIPGS